MRKSTGESLTANEGQTYTIEGGEYTLTDIILDGSGDVVINADINGSEQNDGLTTRENVNVTVNGDIEAVYDGVDANDNSAVIVNGDVSSEDEDGVDADDEAQITVNGDVYGGADLGVGGVDASGDSKIVVNGGVYGGDGQAPDEDGNLVNGTMSDPDGYSDGGTGIEASENAQVIVDGNVYGGDAYGTYGYAGAGINVDGNAKVEVTGSVYGGDQIADPSVAPNTVEEEDNSYTTNGYAGDGIVMNSTADVIVGGDAVGGDASGQEAVAGSGIYIYGSYTAEVYRDSETGETVADPITPGQVTVGGTVVGGDSTAEDGTDGAAVIYAVYDENPVEDSIIPDDIIEQICSNDDTDYLKNIASRAMASIINDAGKYYIDDEVRAGYVDQYAQKITELAKEYGVDIENAESLEDVVAGIPEEKLAEFTVKAIGIGNGIVSEMALGAYAIPKLTLGDMRVTKDSEFIEAPSEELVKYIEDNYLVIKNVNNNYGSSAGNAAVDSPKTGDDTNTAFMGILMAISAMVMVSAGIVISRKKVR